MGGQAAEPVIAVLRSDGTAALRAVRGHLAALVVIGALWSVSALRTGHFDGLWGLLPLSVFVLLDLVARVRTRIALTPHQALVRTSWRTRRLAVAEIHGIEQRPNGSVRVWTADRRHHDLLVGLAGPDGRDAVEVLGQWWLAHRGIGWQPHWAAPSTRWYDAEPGARRVLTAQVSG